MRATQREQPCCWTPEELRRGRPVHQTLPAGSGKRGINPQEILLGAAARGLTRFFVDNLFPSHRRWPPARSVSWQRHWAVGEGLAPGPSCRKPSGASEPPTAPCLSPVAAGSPLILQSGTGTGEQPFTVLRIRRVTFSWDGWGSWGSARLGMAKLLVVFARRGEAAGASAPRITDAKCPWGAGRWLRQPRAAPCWCRQSIAGAGRASHRRAPSPAHACAPPMAHGGGRRGPHPRCSCSVRRVVLHGHLPKSLASPPPAVCRC